VPSNETCPPACNEGGNQRSSEVIRGNQRCHPTKRAHLDGARGAPLTRGGEAEVGDAHLMREAIRGPQRQSELISEDGDAHHASGVEEQVGALEVEVEDPLAVQVRHPSRDTLGH